MKTSCSETQISRLQAVLEFVWMYKVYVCIKCETVMRPEETNHSKCNMLPRTCQVNKG